MNTLFCIGKNYSFKPLQKYSICYAQSLFGEIQCTWFLDSLNDTNCLKNLNYAIESSQNLLILAKDSVLNEILEYFKKYSFSTPIFEKTHHTLAFKNCNIILQESPKITQFRDADNTFLYLLGLDCQSALTLLNPLAKAYQIQLQILQETCGIEILHAKALSHKSLDNFLQEMQQTFQNKIFASSNLAQSIIQLLANSKQKITTAESCTGGLVAYYLTKESGASEVFEGGIISYANAIKESWLKVSNNNLISYGAVSEAVVREMLEGALNLSGADFAIATSGVAGPTGGSVSKPVGTIFIGVKSKNGEEIINRVLFSGDRNYIQEQSCLYAYLLFLKLFFKTIDF